MYLKCLDINGFKSFAFKTKLDFEPGMTAIVGPNGCGKSNISDAIRWVLGEQSAKAMRGAKMEDVIFNGTDNRKPMGMAEVSITFADADKTLGTDYDEVTISRRVFRSGEGEYFINKTPCRLKDIQRLFMDTGIGTTSYSFMEQGKIDRILSSRPEDRRAVFEEASGITKFKADKKEALRKLEQTEANLLRLADVIAEVKRQIGSLQRQAGKARRYKAMRNELRALELHATRERVGGLDQALTVLQGDLNRAGEQLTSIQGEIGDLESGLQSVRENLMATEREIGTTTESVSQSQNHLDRARELILSNQQRIEEYRSWADRDTREVDSTQRQMDDQEKSLLQMRTDQQRIQGEYDEAQKTLQRCTAILTEHQKTTDATRQELQRMRDEAVRVEGLLTKLQNQMVEMDARDRSHIIQRERLAAEKAQLTRNHGSHESRLSGMQSAIQTLRGQAEESESLLAGLEADRLNSIQSAKLCQQKLAETHARSSAVEARLGILQDQARALEGFTGGAKSLLDPKNPMGIDKSSIMGALAEHLRIPPEYETAVEAVLGTWMDAVCVKGSDTARSLLATLQSAGKGSARLVPIDIPPFDPPSNALTGKSLFDQIECKHEVRDAARALLGNVQLVDSAADVPTPVPHRVVFVTPDGMVFRGNGCMEFWMNEPGKSNPLARRQAIARETNVLSGLAREIEAMRAEFQQATAATEKFEKAMVESRKTMDAVRRDLAHKEGEHLIVAREAKEARERLETVTWEHDQLTAQSAGSVAERKAVAAQMDELRAQRERFTVEIQNQTQRMAMLEGQSSVLHSEATDSRIRYANLSQKLEHMGQQSESLRRRVDELQNLVSGRSAGIRSHEANIKRLMDETVATQAQIEPLQKAVETRLARVESLKRNRDKQATELHSMEGQLASRRQSSDRFRTEKADLDVRMAEARMRRQNLVDRVSADYSVTLEEILSAPIPVTEDGQPVSTGLDAIETSVAELKTKIEAMGPVNLVAIEEYKELEERFAFLTAQEADLSSAKQQLMEMIRKINNTTTELFSKTFELVNANFEVMFQKLFNGGTAKLVLVNEEDVLECGIEIIARPPGKRLQNVSLLSGGERTLTAVALLFSIYQIKPSPFCMLDELDAALDESNIGRFVKVLQDFLQQSQFVVITHNRQTISTADILYGVTMPERGISKIVSMKFKDHRTPQTEAPQLVQT